MPLRLRKFIGMVALLTFVMAYALIAMSLGDLIMAKMPQALRFGYYIIAGLFWTIPAMVIIRWMQRPS